MDRRKISKRSGKISPDKFLKVIRNYKFLFSDNNYNYYKNISKVKYIKVKNNCYGEK